MSRRIFWSMIVLLILVSVVCSVPAVADNPWKIRINIPEYRLYLYRGNELQQKFYIAVGKPQNPSPVGNYWIANKTVNPTWYPPDGKPPVPPGPNNPLGKYWMGLNVGGYGIHGNIASWSIGSPASKGCFRMYNNDVEKLFRLVPVGTPVQIVYQTVLGGLDAQNQAWLEVFPDIYGWIDLGGMVQKTLRELKWFENAHMGSLFELLKGKKPFRVQVPRQIAVEGDVESVNGFYWNQDVYLSKNVEVQTGIKPEPVAGVEAGPFGGYTKLNIISGYLEGWYRWIWDYPSAKLRINRLKVIYHGVEIERAGRMDTERRIWLDLAKIAGKLGAEFTWDDAAAAADCNGVRVEGDLKSGAFWIEAAKISLIWPDIHPDWDESGWSLKLVEVTP